MARNSVRAKIKLGSMIVLCVLMSSSFLVALPAGLINFTNAQSTPSTQSTPTNNSNTTNPGTVMSNYPLIISHLVQKGNSLVYVTNFGNYTFAKSTPWKLSSFIDRAGQSLTSGGFFTIANFTTSVSAYSIIADTPSLFSVQYSLAQNGNNVGNMTVTYNFDYEPVNQVPLEPKISVVFSPSVSSTIANAVSVSWLIVPVDQYIEGNSVQSATTGIGNVTEIAQSNGAPIITIASDYSMRQLPGVGADHALLVGPSTDSSNWANQRPGGVLYVNWADSGVVPSVAQGLLPTSSAIQGKGIDITFTSGLYNIDPTLSASSLAAATDGSSQRKTFFSDGLFWAFYAANGWIEYSNSVNGSIFSSPTNTSIAAENGNAFSVYNNNASVMYLAVANYAQSGFYKQGLLFNNGTVLWSSAVDFSGASGQALSSPSISVTEGNVFVTVFASSGSSADYYLYENGVLLQSLPASALSGLSLGNPTTSSAGGASGSCFSAAFTPLTTGIINEIYTYLDAVNIGTLDLGIYNSTDSLIASGSTTMSSNVEAVFSAAIPSTGLVAEKTYYLAAATSNGEDENWVGSSSTGGTATQGACSGLPSSPNFGSAITDLMDIWAPMSTVNESLYQTPIALPLSQNFSYFLYGSSSGLQGESYNATTRTSPSLIESAHGGTTAKSIGMSFGSATTAGDTLIVAVGDVNDGIYSLTDSQGNSYTELSSSYYSGAPGYYGSIWYATTSSSSLDSITVKYLATTYGYAAAFEVSGLASGSLASYSTGDGYSGNYGTQSNVTAYLPSPGSFVVAVCACGYSSLSAGTEYTLETGSGTYDGAAEYNSTWLGGSTTSPIILGAASSYAEISAAFPPASSGFSSSSLVGQNLTVGDNVASAVPLNGKIYLTYLQTDTSGLYSIIYKSYSGTSWSSPTIVESGITSPVHPVISINNATKDLYVFWAGYPQLNHVYYDFYNATSSTWSPVVTWLNATDFTPSDGMGYSSLGSFESISVAPYAVHGIIGVEYETGLSSPYSIQYSLLVDPPKQSEVNIYNAIQAAQDYLTRLERNSNTSSPTSVLSEYPALPLTVRYSDGCYVSAQNAGGTPNGGYNSGCPSTSIINVPTISTNNNLGTTSENYTYDFTDPADYNNNPCSGYASSPELQVVTTWYGYQGNGPTFQYTDNVYLTQFDDPGASCSVAILIGNHVIAENIGYSLSGHGTVKIGSWSGTVTTYPKGGGGVNWGFDFNPFTGPGATPNLGINSFRYTTRSGMQSEWKWALAAGQQDFPSNSGSLSSVVQNELYGATQPFTVQDVYTPAWFYGQSQPYSMEGNTSLSGVFNDCASSNQPGNLPSNIQAFGWTYPYQSKVCLSPADYVANTYGYDPLIAGLTAIQVLNQYGPNDAIVPWDGSNYTAAGFAEKLITQSWVGSDGVYYPAYGSSWSSLFACFVGQGSGCITGPGTGYSSVRTAVAAELFTLLGYKYGLTNYNGYDFQTYAGSMVAALVDGQWGMDTSTGNSGCVIACGTIQFGSNTYNLFRPSNTGGELTLWNSNFEWNNASASSILDRANMPAEYLGNEPTDQEATQVSLIALMTYYNLVTDPSGNTLNDGVQPFYNDVFQNTGNSVQTHYFSANDISASGNYVLNLNLVNEGDGYNRNLDVTLNGQTVGSYVLKVGGGTNSSSTPYADTVYTISVPLGTLLSTSANSIGIELSTYNYTTPFNWWVVDGSVALNQVHISTGGGLFSVTTSASTQTGTAPLSVSFTSTISGGTSPYTYYWTFGDGGTSTSANPSHTYSNSGVYDAQVTVTDTNSLKATSSPAQITVTNGASCTPPPVSQTISFTSYSGVNGNPGGASATVKNVGCQSVSGVIWFVAFNSLGETVGLASAPAGSLSVGGTSSQTGYFTFSSGTYTIDMFVTTPDMVSLSQVASVSYTA